MGRRSSNKRLITSTAAIAIFLIMSSFIGSFLLAKDASAGGLDVEWKVPLPAGFQQMLVAPDGSMIVKGNGGLIEDIDRNGTVKWAFGAGNSFGMNLGSDGAIYFIQSGSNSSSSVVSLHGNGTPNWRYDASRSIRSLQIGTDGNLYFVENPGTNSILVCLTKNGTEAWQTTPDGSDLADNPIAIFGDGTVLAKSMVHNWSRMADGGIDYVISEIRLNAISRDGSVRWQKVISAGVGNFILCDGPLMTGNGTLQFIFTDQNSTQSVVGFVSDSSVAWSCQNEHLAFPGTVGPDNVTYYIENYQDQPWGYPVHNIGVITARNTSTGALIWSHSQDGWVLGPLAMCHDSSLFLVTGELMRFSSNGSVLWKTDYFASEYQANVARILDNDGNCGILCAQDSTLSMIDGNGVRTWEFPLDSPALGGTLGHDGRIIVLTNEYAISIHKPALTTTMNYFVVLLAIDLFISLMFTVRFFDMIWPQKKAKSD